MPHPTRAEGTGPVSSHSNPVNPAVPLANSNTASLVGCGPDGPAVIEGPTAAAATCGTIVPINEAVTTTTTTAAHERRRRDVAAVNLGARIQFPVPLEPSKQSGRTLART